MARVSGDGSETLYVFQKGFNYGQDGPGNRLVYHLSGCNMHCPWCSNPEGMEPGGGTGHSVRDLIAEAISCRPMFFDSGGVTLTGGEISFQFSGAAALLRGLKEAGIHTAIETNASSPRFTELLPITDRIMADFKHYSDDVLCAVTGVGNARIVKNLRDAVDAGYELHLRIPLINGFNAAESDIGGFLAFLSTLPSDRFDVELLPYHEYGRDKWAKLGRLYTVENGRITKETLAAFTDAFRAAGIRVIRS